VLLNAAPDFWIATIAIVFLASAFGWIPPIGGVAGIFENPGVNFQQFLLPALILGTGGAASLTRYTRNQLLEVIRQDYIRTAFAKGLTSRRVWYVHAVKNAMIPVITNAGSHLGGLMGGTVIIENIFSLPGVGQLTLSAIHHRDVPQLEINVVFLATVFILVNLLVDLTYGWLDPRIRYS
jgi:peptide/nickel transport system permease protein